MGRASNWLTQMLEANKAGSPMGHGAGHFASYGALPWFLMDHLVGRPLAVAQAKSEIGPEMAAQMAKLPARSNLLQRLQASAGLIAGRENSLTPLIKNPDVLARLSRRM